MFNGIVFRSVQAQIMRAVNCGRGKPSYEAGRFGNQRQNIAAAVSPAPATVKIPIAKPAAAAILETSNGPPQVPISVMNRHKPKN